jgi:hypothetical protein
MKVWIGLCAAAFVKKNDCTRLHSSQNTRGDRLYVPTYRIETANCPPNQDHSALLQSWMDEKILQTGRRSKIVTRNAGLIDLPRNPGGSSAPECATRVRGSMVRNLVTSGADCLQFSRKFRCAFADDKKGRPGLETPQNLQRARRMNWVWSVINRQPNFRARCFETRYNRTPPLTVCDQRWGENEEMRKEKNTERDPGMESDHDDKKKRGQERETEDEWSAGLRLHRQTFR